jgi:hypothetical protein
LPRSRWHVPHLLFAAVQPAYGVPLRGICDVRGHREILITDINAPALPPRLGQALSSVDRSLKWNEGNHPRSSIRPDRTGGPLHVAHHIE